MCILQIICGSFADCAIICRALLQEAHLAEQQNVGLYGEVGGWGRDPKKCTGRDWGMGSSTI